MKLNVVLGYASLLWSASLWITPPAFAYELDGPIWANNEYAFRANTASFDTNVDDTDLLTFSATDFEWWIAWSASQWVERTGADF